MKEIKMSVIVPTHGRVDLFKETLECLVKQTSREFEIIVTDDSSNKEEQEIIKKLVNDASSNNKDLKIRYIFSEPNLLQSKNTNQGLKNAVGKYLRILHSDDILAPTCIETEIQAFEDNPECYFLNHVAKSFSDSFKCNLKEKIQISTFNIFDCWLKKMIFTNCILPTSLAFRKEIYLNIGGFDDKYKFLCDWDFFFRMILNEYLSGRSEAIFISGSLVGWRQHSESITSTMCLTHFYEHEELINKIVEIYKSHKILNKKDLHNAIICATDYRYNRVISDYKKYNNFILPKIPMKYVKAKKFEKMNIKFLKLRKHLDKFYQPFKFTFEWLIQPISIVDKSTVPVGTAQIVSDIIKKYCNFEFDVVSNPEFLKQGAAVEDFLRPDRVVIGANSEKAKNIMINLYATFVRNQNPIITMDTNSAEMVKYASNSFLALKISYINEIANICEKVGADINKVRMGMCADSRIGTKFLYPGLGYGGSCFPKDVKALIKTAKENQCECKLIQSADEINKNQRKKFIDKIIKNFGEDLTGKTFAVWGLAFKPKTNDMREAPSITIINNLIERGAKIKAYDPKAYECALTIFGDKIEYGKSSYEVLKDADALLLITEWNEFRNPDFDLIKTLLKNPIIYDGRNQFDESYLNEIGFDYYQIGKKNSTKIKENLYVRTV